MSKGWLVTCASMLSLGIIFGTSYSFGAFFAALSESFQAKRADISLVFGLAGFLYFIAGAGGGIAAVQLGHESFHPAAWSCSDWEPWLQAKQKRSRKYTGHTA